MIGKKKLDKERAPKREKIEMSAKFLKNVEALETFFFLIA